jgi:putative ABC transport system ATP-binding protein
MFVIESLSKSYTTGKQSFPVLNNISLTVHEGDFIMIMGESGSGKSTFLNCISSLDRPSSGTIRFKDEDLSTLSAARIQTFRNQAVAFVFQENVMMDTLTMKENVMLAALEHNPDVSERALSLMRTMRVDQIADKFPGQVSTGERQRCALARALINQPTVLFADEPTAALNPQFAKEVMELLQKLNEQGQTIVMVTHSLRMAAYGNRFLLLRDGSFQVDERLSGDLSTKHQRLFSLASDIL